MATSPITNTGKTVSIACNLPHGLTVAHAEKTVTLAGANHPRAIVTGSSRSGRWGITHNVAEDWFDDWVKTHAPQAVANGHIVKNSAAKIEDQAIATGDKVKTGADPLDPANPTFQAENGVETREDAD